MPTAETATTTPARRNNNKRKAEREGAIIEGALRVFGERGFEAATVSAICDAAGVSDATLYEYFSSKEEVLFSIVERYTKQELERIGKLAHYVRDPKEKLRVIILAYLEFYEDNPLYTSVALLTLKGNRRFIDTPQYEAVRAASRTIVETAKEGIESGAFREDVDPHLVRNLVLGFVEHLTIQWLLVKRPSQLASLADTIHEWVLRVIEKKPDRVAVELSVDRAALLGLLGQSDGGK